MSEPEIEVENRKKIYELIEEFPGLHMREIKRRTDMSMNLVRYHLSQLKRYKVVEEVEEGEYKRYYPKKGEKRVDLEDKRYLALLREEIPLAVVVYLLSEGEPVSHGDIKEELDIAASTLSYHLKKMRKKGLLTREGRQYWLTNPEEISNLLVKYEPPKDVIDEFIDLWESLSLGMIF
ncbi:MAG: helix-turn-helix domain-containing protein [Candidatus Thermoplasmatota archaeon]|nr:helix-turn-helix domain-containing protein [Candidatus Thermoplasmatota archaeon]MBS3790412.1 helix-turn-helix domain-containing protein [Candidatus Thermoplasmatota archaeon]